MADEIIFDRRLSVSRAPSPTLRDVLAVIFRQRRVILISFTVIFLACFLYGFLSPAYEAGVKVLLRRGRVDPPMTPQPTATSEFLRTEITEEELNSEVELLRDAGLLREVVLATNLAERERSFWRRNPEPEVRIARAVRHLSQKLTVEPIKKARLISVKYESGDPALAARVLKTLASSYMEKHLEILRPTGELRFFQAEANRYRRSLEAAEEDLLRQTRERGVVSAALERDMALQKLSDADASYRQTGVAIAETEHRMGALRAQLAAIPERTTTMVRTLDNPQLQEHLKSTLLTLELKRTELLTKFQPSYRLVQEVEQQILQTKAAIEAERLTPVQEQTTERDVTYEWTRSELEKAQVELSGLRARELASGGLVAGYRSLTTRLAADSIRQQDLLRTVKMNEDNFLLYARKSEEARIGDALDERGILNVALVQEPRVPVLPKKSPVFFAFFGLMVAAVASAGIAFAADYLDPAIRTPEELLAVLGMPVLASMPQKSLRVRSR